MPLPYLGILRFVFRTGCVHIVFRLVLRIIGNPHLNHSFAALLRALELNRWHLLPLSRNRTIFLVASTTETSLYRITDAHLDWNGHWLRSYTKPLAHVSSSQAYEPNHLAPSTRDIHNSLPQSLLNTIHTRATREIAESIPIPTPNMNSPEE